MKIDKWKFPINLIALVVFFFTLFDIFTFSFSHTSLTTCFEDETSRAWLTYCWFVMYTMEELCVTVWSSKLSVHFTITESFWCAYKTNNEDIIFFFWDKKLQKCNIHFPLFFTKRNCSFGNFYIYQICYVELRIINKWRFSRKESAPRVIKLETFYIGKKI